MIFDSVVLFVLVASAVIAFLRGFIREVLTILGVVGGLAASYFGGPLIAPTIKDWLVPATEEEAGRFIGLIPYNLLSDIIAYGSIFIIVVLILSLFSHMLASWAKTAGLGAIDRTLGVIFGLARGAIIIGLLYLPLYLLVDNDVRADWFAKSKTRMYVEATSDFMAEFLPSGMTKDKESTPSSTIGQSAREKLQELDILGGAKSKPDNNTNKNAPGYKADERENLNNLIENNLNE